jgi:hypothetical protein
VNKVILDTIHELRNVLTAVQMSDALRFRTNALINTLWTECLACGKEDDDDNRDVAQPG